MRSLLTAAMAALVGLYASGARGADIIVPPGFANTQGGLGGVAPFSFPTTAGIRTQIVYDASLFSGLSGPQSISAIRFRPIDPAGGFFGTTLNVSSAQLQLSTTSRSGESNPLSTTFASNIGADVQTVFSGPLSLTTAGVGSPTGPFDYVINLQTPFVYDPASGNLLLDTRVNPGETVSGNGFFGAFPRFDTTGLLNDGLFTVLNFNLGANPDSGTLATAGPITQFVVTPVIAAEVPEPSSFLIGALAAALALGQRFLARKGRATSQPNPAA